MDCSAFAAAERGERNVVDGCIVDLIFRDHGWGVHIAVGCEEFEIDVCIPLKDLPHG